MLRMIRNKTGGAPRRQNKNDRNHWNLD